MFNVRKLIWAQDLYTPYINLSASPRSTPTWVVFGPLSFSFYFEFFYFIFLYYSRFYGPSLSKVSEELSMTHGLWKGHFMKKGIYYMLFPNFRTEIWVHVVCSFTWDAESYELVLSVHVHLKLQVHKLRWN